MSPSPRSNVRPCSAPVTGKETSRRSRLASPAEASAITPPTIKRAEIATTRPQGDKRIAAHDTSGSGQETRAEGEDSEREAQAGAAVRVTPVGAVELTGALTEQQHRVGGGTERVGDRVAVLERERRPQLVADLGEQDVAAGHT